MLNDRHKHKTVHPECAQYLDKLYHLSLLLKLRTQSHETQSFGKSFHADTDYKKIHKTLILNNLLVILKLCPQVIMNEKKHPLPNQQTYKTSSSKSTNL